MKVDIPSIRNKYLRWMAASIATVTIIPVAYFLTVVEPVCKETFRAYHNLQIKRQIQENKKIVSEFVKTMYKGRK